MNIINRVAGSPGPLYVGPVTNQTRVTFAIFYDSPHITFAILYDRHLPNTNCYQFIDPGEMEGLVGLSNDKLSNLLKVAKKIASRLGGIEHAT